MFCRSFLISIIYDICGLFTVITDMLTSATDGITIDVAIITTHTATDGTTIVGGTIAGTTGVRGTTIRGTDGATGHIATEECELSHNVIFSRFLTEIHRAKVHNIAGFCFKQYGLMYSPRC